MDEGTALRASPRALAESYLQERGATVLTLSGIVSEAAEARSICSCLRGYLGRASAPHSLGKTINLVHEMDIVEATCACLDRTGRTETGRTSEDENESGQASASVARPIRGARYNVAGRHVSLRELLTLCGDKGGPGAEAHEGGVFIEGGADLSSKTVLSQRLIDEVMPAGFAFRPIAPDAGEIGEIGAEVGAEVGGEHQAAAAGVGCREGQGGAATAALGTAGLPSGAVSDAS